MKALNSFDQVVCAEGRRFPIAAFVRAAIGNRRPIPKNHPILVAVALLALTTNLFAQAEVEVHMTPATTASPDVQLQQENFTRAAAFGQKYFAIGEYASAYGEFVKAEEIQPANPGILFNTALLLARMGRYAEAQTKIDTYLKLHPSGAEIDKVKTLQLDLDFERELQKKAQETQSYVELFNRARFTAEKGDYATALKLFQDAEKQHPEDAAAVLNQAIVLEAMGEYSRATERLRKYQALAPASDKADVDQRIFALESETQDIATSVLCPFCGFKLAKGSLWCPHCWHGPYVANAATYNTRPCGRGATATRTTFYMNDRVHQNEDLPCTLPSGPFAETLRYSKPRQRAIQQARRDEGWTYEGDVLQSFRDRDGNVIRLIQGATLEKLVNLSTGDVLSFSGRDVGGKWLLDREEFVIDGQKHRKVYTYDANGRIAAESVRYQNGLACGHIIQNTATYNYTGEKLSSVSLKGAYLGYETEGAPQMDWAGTIALFYDADGRLTKEEFTVDTHSKTYTKKPFGPLRDQIEQMYPSMRVKKPLDIKRQGDLCSIFGSKLVGNLIDLRPFFTVAPDLAVPLPLGVVKVTVNVTYPDGFKIE